MQSRRDGKTVLGNGTVSGIGRVSGKDIEISEQDQIAASGGFIFTPVVRNFPSALISATRAVGFVDALIVAAAFKFL